MQEASRDHVTYQALILEVHRRNRLCVPLQCPNARSISLNRTLRPTAITTALSDTVRVLFCCLILFGHVAKAEHLTRLPIFILIHLPQVPNPHATILTTGQANVVLDLYALHRPAVPAQATDLLAGEQVPHAWLRVVLAGGYKGAVRF